MTTGLRVNGVEVHSRARQGLLVTIQVESGHGRCSAGLSDRR